MIFILLLPSPPPHTPNHVRDKEKTRPIDQHMSMLHGSLITIVMDDEMGDDAQCYYSKMSNVVNGFAFFFFSILAR